MSNGCVIEYASQTYGIRRRSIKSRSEVRTKTTVMSIILPFDFFGFESGAFLSPHSTSNSTSRGLEPSLNVTSFSAICKKYCGSCLTEARSSWPKGGLRFKS